MEKKITKATLKSFIKKNSAELFLNVTSDFDSYTDCCQKQHGGFHPAKFEENKNCNKYNFGVEGLWIVGKSGNLFSAYDDGVFAGIRYYNCCGCGVIAVKKAA